MNPLDIYQAALNVVSLAVLAGDFETYADQIDLPYLIHTRTGRLLVSTREDLRPAFQALYETIRGNNVTHYERVARSADYVDRDRIEGLHFTHLISYGERIKYPHSSRHVIVRRGTPWRFSEAFYQIDANQWPVDRETIEKQFGLALRAQDHE